MITDVAGVRVGHWTDRVAQTGCTAIVLPPESYTSGEVRGGAPGTRDFELLAPGRVVRHVDVVMLTGGSAFGLAACDGAMRWCEEQGLGYETLGGRVPIVVGAVVYDLTSGDGSVRPGPEEGYAACAAAASGPFATGRVGAGTGTTIAKVPDRDRRRPGGLGTATVRHGDVIVAALMVVNAMGDIREGVPALPVAAASAMENTTIGVVVTNATLSKTDCFVAAQGAHAGLARAIEPVHTRSDGDALVMCASREVDADVSLVAALAAQAVEAAIRHAVSPPTRA